MSGVDIVSYEAYFEKVLRPMLREYAAMNAGVIVDTKVKEKIWDNYVVLNRHCKETYMSDEDKLIDRHKVAACYMYSIL